MTFVGVNVPVPCDNHVTTNDCVTRAYKQLVLPTSKSGFGLRRAVATLNQAYIASIVACFNEDIEWWERNGPTTIQHQNPMLIRYWTNAIDVIKKQIRAIDEKRITPQTCDILQFIDQVNNELRKEQERGIPQSKSKQPNLSRLQKTLQESYYKKELNQLVDSFYEQKEVENLTRDVARIKLNLVKNNSTHEWIYAVPSHNNLIMSNDNYELAMRRRLGLPLYDDMRNFECVCGILNAFQDPNHALICKQTRYIGYHGRHNQIITNMAEYMRRLGFHVSVELNNTSEKDRKRTDLVVIVGSPAASFNSHLAMLSISLRLSYTIALPSGSRVAVLLPLLLCLLPI
jgi:hypothetical protein